MYAYIRPINPAGPMMFVEVIAMDIVEGVPPRPHPGPTPPTPPNWRPEHPEHPIANPWPPYVDVSPPTGQPGPGVPPVRPAAPPTAGQLPQSELGGWMYLYSPQYQRWLWAWTGATVAGPGSPPIAGNEPPPPPPLRPSQPLPPAAAPKTPQ